MRTAWDTPCTTWGAAICCWAGTRTHWSRLRQALASHQATGNRRRQAATLRSLADAQNRAGLTAEARESWTQAAAIFEALGDSAEAAEIRAEQDASGSS